MTFPLDDGGGELEASDEPPAWTAPAFGDPDRETRMLAGVAQAAQEASARETKLAALARLLSTLARMREPAIVFTEYRDTLAHVEQTLGRTSPGLGVAGVIHGGLTREERRKVLDDFRNRRVMVLLATDAGGQGLNLHHTCRVVINLELPWNPMRLEQRVGRVDRIGQSRRVHAFNLIARDTGELRVFDHLKARLDLARQDIGVPDPLDSPGEEIEETRVLDVVTGQAGDELKTETSDDAERSATPVRAYDMPQLAGEASAEHTRLVRARALLSEHADAKSNVYRTGGRPAQLSFTRAPAGDIMAADSDTWLAFARHPKTRSRLAPDVLVLLQSIVEDRLGRVAASHVLPLLIRSSERVRRADARRVVLDITRTLDGWSIHNDADSHSRALHQQFWNIRLARERAIAATLARAGRTFQPGLFDRRGEHDVDLRTMLVDDLLRRLAFIEWTVLLGVTRTRVALVLLP